MKKLVLILTLFCAFASTTNAQRFAYVDTEFILDHMPDYKSAQKKLDNQAQQWQYEIDQSFKAVDKLVKKFRAEQFLLTEELRDQRQKEIYEKEKEAQSLQKKYFGYEGELFKKRKELIQPIQDKIYDAVQKIAEDRAFDFILDKASGGATLLYTNTKHDLSELVLRRLGH